MDCYVVVADGARARMFSLNRRDDITDTGGLDLVERDALVNPEQEMRGNEVYENTKSGRNRVSGGPAHGYDDHRSASEVEQERRFARQIADRIGGFSEGGANPRIVLVAAPRMLGLLRPALQGSAASKLRVDTLDKDLSRLSPKELKSHLATAGLIPKS